jgi:hypothetical protein
MVAGAARQHQSGEVGRQLDRVPMAYDNAVPAAAFCVENYSRMAGPHRHELASAVASAAS